MRNTKGEAAIKKVAQQNGVSVEQVRSEMKKAILEGYRNPETRAKWNELFGEGHLPEPEEFIVVMSKQVNK
jgi:hypothetical protein